MSDMEASINRSAKAITTLSGTHQVQNRLLVLFYMLHTKQPAHQTLLLSAFLPQKERYSASALEARTIKLQYVRCLLDDVVAFIQHLKQRNLSERR